MKNVMIVFVFILTSSFSFADEICGPISKAEGCDGSPCYTTGGPGGDLIYLTGKTEDLRDYVNQSVELTGESKTDKDGKAIFEVESANPVAACPR